MIYCREKLIDVILESPWISLEERFDFDVTLANCIRLNLFSKRDWEVTEYFLSTGENYDITVELVLKLLAVKLGYTDERFFQDKPEKTKSYYYAMEKGVRL